MYLLTFTVWEKYTCAGMLVTLGLSFLLSFQRLLCVIKFDQMNKADATQGYVPIPVKPCTLFDTNQFFIYTLMTVAGTLFCLVINVATLFRIVKLNKLHHHHHQQQQQQQQQQQHKQQQSWRQRTEVNMFVTSVALFFTQLMFTVYTCLTYSLQFQLALGSGWLWPKVQAQGVWAFDIYGLGQPWIVLAMNRGVRNAMLECLLLGGGRAAANQRTHVQISGHRRPKVASVNMR